MKRLIPIFAIVLGWAPVALGATPAPLTSLDAVSRLTNEQAGQYLPAAFEATVLYYRNYEKTMFVQDGDAAIYIQATTNLKLVPGDRILIRGTTQPSFRPYVRSSDIALLHHGTLPTPKPATYDEMIRSKFDCMLVTVHARVRAADIVLSSGVPSVVLQLLTDGGTIEAGIDSADSKQFEGLLDADVEITGADAGRFDGKMQQTGIILHVQSWDGVKVLKRADTRSDALPITPMDQILMGYHVRVLSQRVRVHGTVTYYQPGS
ncbi:MAG: hypothetical protein ACLPY1_08015, partial [Terracidiphilus sp.]